MSSPYTEHFYLDQESGSRRSAERIVPILVELLSPASVIDVGCGSGQWLEVFKEKSAATVLGVDGPWASPRALSIDATDFIAYDFAVAEPPFAFRAPLDKYDLAISLEFLEHLDAAMAPALVHLLCDLSDVVLVSAAIPRQGGTRHVNEQWPSYWSALFKKNDYVPCDILRPLLWNIPDIEPWYAQNAILYFREKIPAHILHAAERSFTNMISDPYPLVHPRLFMTKTDLMHYSGKELMRAGCRKGMKKLQNKVTIRTDYKASSRGG
jgi:SAM-dependent methyltransferase